MFNNVLDFNKLNIIYVVNNNIINKVINIIY